MVVWQGGCQGRGEATRWGLGRRLPGQGWMVAIEIKIKYVDLRSVLGVVIAD